MIEGILFCRNYRRAHAAYDEGKPAKEQTELLMAVDAWRREEDARIDGDLS